MRLILAPMEGLTDPLMRRLLTTAGRYDWCVSEFIRVTDQLLPVHVLDHFCPERADGWQTASGTPLHVQFLGSDPQALADNAAQAAALGAPAIDLNFGCPAKTVNRHRGGAALLDETELIYQIVHTVRQAVPAATPVSAKMRLGYLDDAPAVRNAQAIEAAGASWLTLHARTKADAYTPPAHWDKIAPVRAALRIPVIANGEIWTPEDAESARQQSGCTDLMLGRGAVTRPDLVRVLRGESLLSWADLLTLQLDFLQGETRHHSQPQVKLLGRYKQWLGMLTKGYPEAVQLWDQVKKIRDPDEVKGVLRAQSAAQQTLAPEGFARHVPRV